MMRVCRVQGVLGRIPFLGWGVRSQRLPLLLPEEERPGGQILRSPCRQENLNGRRGTNDQSYVYGPDGLILLAAWHD